MEKKETPNGIDVGSLRSLELNTSSTIELTGVIYESKEKQLNNEKGNQELEKIHPTSDLDALLHVVKSSLGSGILAISDGFKNAGTVVGIVGTVFIGMLCTHCTYVMVKCSQDMCRMLNKPFLGYTETVEQALLYCANKRFSRYAGFVRNCVEGSMFFTYYGVNTVYIILVSNSFQSIIETQFDIHYNIRVYICAFAIPFFLVGIVRNMKYLVPFSAIANVLLFVGLCLTFYYLFTDLPSFSSRPAAVKITQFPLFFSTVLFGMEGIGTMLPIENSMKKPKHFLGCPGVLTIAMTIVVSLFCGLGLIGYVKYGDETEANITLNLPGDALAQSVKALVALAVLFSYGLQLAASMDVVWKRLEHRFDKSVETKRYYQVRATMILGTVILALAVPNLGPVISLIGAVGFSMCGFFFPALCETVICWEKGFGKWNYILWKNIFLAIVAILAVISGSITSMADIIAEYS